MQDATTLRQRLTEAESAYHLLITGSAEVHITKGDRSVSYNQTSVASLLAYIKDLRAQLVALGELPASALGTRRRLIEVIL